MKGFTRRLWRQLPVTDRLRYRRVEAATCWAARLQAYELQYGIL